MASSERKTTKKRPRKTKTVAKKAPPAAKKAAPGGLPNKPTLRDVLEYAKSRGEAKINTTPDDPTPLYDWLKTLGAPAPSKHLRQFVKQGLFKTSGQEFHHVRNRNVKGILTAHKRVDSHFALARIGVLIIAREDTFEDSLLFDYTTGSVYFCEGDMICLNSISLNKKTKDVEYLDEDTEKDLLLSKPATKRLFRKLMVFCVDESWATLDDYIRFVAGKVEERTS